MRLALVPLREERVDLPRQVRDLLRQLLVLLCEVGVRLKQLEDSVGLRLRRSLEPAVALFDSLGVQFVAIRYPFLMPLPGGSLVIRVAETAAIRFRMRPQKLTLAGGGSAR